MRILVAWAGDSSPNLGVRALGQGSADLLHSIWPSASVEFVDFGNRPAQIPWGRPRSLVRERVTGRLGMMGWLRGFDMIWDTRSGDSFADIYGPNRHRKMSLIHEFATEAGVPVVLAPQTIGPFHTLTGRALARRNLRRSRLVFARDPLSADAAAALGRPVDATATDLVFGIRPPDASTARDVILNVSGLLWKSSSHVNHDGYRATVHGIIDGLLAEGRGVTLLPHVLDSHDPDNDVPVSVQLRDEYDGRIDLHVPDGLDDARAAIASAQLVIGARMHACLNALSTGTPSIAMAYSRKFQPLMDSIGWPHVVSLTDGEDVADDVLARARTAGLAASAREAMLVGQSRLARIIPSVAEIL